LIAFRDGVPLYNEAARDFAARDPTKAIRQFKRILGMGQDAPAVQDYRRSFPYHKYAVDFRRKSLLIEIDGIKWGAEELLARSIDDARARGDLTAFMGTPGLEPVTKVLFAVPMYWSQVQTDTIRKIGERLDLKIEAVVSDIFALGIVLAEPDFGKAASTGQAINGRHLVYSCGAFGVSVAQVFHSISLDRQGTETLTIASRSYVHDFGMGGYLIDDELLAHFSDLINDQLQGTTLKKHPVALERVRSMIKNLKEGCLNLRDECTYSLDDLVDNVGLHGTITRADYHAIIAPVVTRLIEPLRAFKSITSEDFDANTSIELYGGTTYIQPFADLITAEFPNLAIQRNLTQDAILRGTGLFAASLLEDPSLPTITPFEEHRDNRLSHSAEPMFKIDWDKVDAHDETIRKRQDKLKEVTDAALALSVYADSVDAYLTAVTGLPDDLRATVTQELKTTRDWMHSLIQSAPIQDYRITRQKMRAVVEPIKALYPLAKSDNKKKTDNNNKKKKRTQHTEL
jgi:molecular chaperone DnaK (HSP70)